MTTLTLTAFQFMPNCFIFQIKILCVQVFCLHICLCTICTQCPQRPDKSIRSPGIEVVDTMSVLETEPRSSSYCWAIFPAPKPNYYFILFKVAHKPVPGTWCVYTPFYSFSPHPLLISMCFIAYVFTFHIPSADPQIRTPWKQHLGFGLLF